MKRALAQVVRPSASQRGFRHIRRRRLAMARRSGSRSTGARQYLRRRGGIGHGAVPLIFLNVGTERRPYRYGMTDAAPSEDQFCPVCDGPMRLLTTIRSAFAEDRRVFQCKPCGLSTTETVRREGPIR